jgi:hypothetical protein
MLKMEKPDFDNDFPANHRLFHYTNSAGLAGILQSNCLWATHFQFLNDSKEFYAARTSLEEFVRVAIHTRAAAVMVNTNRKLKEGEILRERARDTALRIVAILYEATLGDESGTVTPYVFSAFCCGPDKAELFTDGGLLHWATYGRNGGYALQINPHSLLKLIQADERLSCMSRRVAYATGDKIPFELTSDYKELGNVVKNAVDELLDGGELNAKNLGPALAPFLRIISLLKDSYFEPENEARFVMARTHDVPEGVHNYDVHIRPVGPIVIPYVRLFEGTLLGEENPIERIIVGPHAENSRRIVALRTYLRARNLNIKVTESKVPYLSLPS